MDSIVTFQGISERLGFVLTYLGNHPLAGGGGEKDRAHAVRKEFLPVLCHTIAASCPFTKACYGPSLRSGLKEPGAVHHQAAHRERWKWSESRLELTM